MREALTGHVMAATISAPFKLMYCLCVWTSRPYPLTFALGQTIRLLCVTCVGFDVKEALTGDVIAATSSASFKLIFVCSAVGWLLRTNRLPRETKDILSKVS